MRFALSPGQKPPVRYEAQVLTEAQRGDLNFLEDLVCSAMVSGIARTHRRRLNRDIRGPCRHRAAWNPKSELLKVSNFDQTK